MHRLLIPAALALLSVAAAAHLHAQPLRVLQLNIWQEGTKVPDGYSAMVDQIVASGADIVTLSEVRNYRGTRFCDRIVRSLAERGHTFRSFYSYDSGILSRFPIADSATVYPCVNDHGSVYKAVVRAPQGDIAVYTAHLDYLSCAYYMTKGYDGSTWRRLDSPLTDVDSLLRVNRASMRDDGIRAFVADAAAERAKGRAVILGGDFNEPSHLDWTAETSRMFERNGLVVPWTVSLLLDSAGYADAYRTRHPNPATHPGITYPADCPQAKVQALTWAPLADERERIDYIFFAPSPRTPLRVKEAVVWGPKGSICASQRVLEAAQDSIAMGSGIAWPSDHKGVLVVFDNGK